MQAPLLAGDGEEIRPSAPSPSSSFPPIAYPYVSSNPLHPPLPEPDDAPLYHHPHPHPSVLKDGTHSLPPISQGGGGVWSSASSIIRDPQLQQELIRPIGPEPVQPIAGPFSAASRIANVRNQEEVDKALRADQQVS